MTTPLTALHGPTSPQPPINYTDWIYSKELIAIIGTKDLKGCIINPPSKNLNNKTENMAKWGHDGSVTGEGPTEDVRKGVRE